MPHATDATQSSMDAFWQSISKGIEIITLCLLGILSFIMTPFWFLTSFWAFAANGENKPPAREDVLPWWRRYFSYTLLAQFGWTIWMAMGWLMESSGSKLLDMLWHDVAFGLGMGTVYLGFKALHPKGAWSMMRSEKNDQGPMIRWQLFALGAFVCLAVNMVPFTLLLYASGMAALRQLPLTLGPIILIQTFVLTPIQTLCEEILCRMIPYNAMGLDKDSSVAQQAVYIIATTLKFVLAHGQYMAISFYYAFCITGFFGISTALLTMMTDGIELSWGIHWMHNSLCMIPLATTIMLGEVSILFFVAYEGAILGLCYAALKCFPHLTTHLATNEHQATKSAKMATSNGADSKNPQRKNGPLPEPLKLPSVMA